MQRSFTGYAYMLDIKAQNIPSIVKIRHKPQFRNMLFDLIEINMK